MLARLLWSLLFAVLTAPAQVLAQGIQTAEDQDVGVRLSIPKAWEWRKRDTNPRPSLFVNCMPQVASHYPCFLLVEYFNAPAGQAAIADADRRKWESWSSAYGDRKIVSARDSKVGGNPAYAIVVMHGVGPSARRGLDVYVLAAGAGRVFRLSYMASEGDKDHFDRYKPAIDAAIQSFTILPVAPAAAKGKK